MIDRSQHIPLVQKAFHPRESQDEIPQGCEEDFCSSRCVRVPKPLVFALIFLGLPEVRAQVGQCHGHLAAPINPVPIGKRASTCHPRHLPMSYVNAVCEVQHLGSQLVLYIEVLFRESTRPFHVFMLRSLARKFQGLCRALKGAKLSELS